MRQIKTKGSIEKPHKSSQGRYSKPPTFKYNSLNMAKSIQGYIHPTDKEFDLRIADPLKTRPPGGMWNKQRREVVDEGFKTVN